MKPCLFKSVSLIKTFVICVLSCLCGCASIAPVSESVARRLPDSLWTQGGWQNFRFPGKAVTEFSETRLDGRDAMAATAVSSASMLRRKVYVAADDLGRVRFSWKVPGLIAQADLALRDRADSPVRIVLAFEGDRSKFSSKNAMLSELAHVLTGEPMPYATLMYVWCNTRPPGTVIVSPRSDRIRKLVVESGANNLNHWLDYERNIRADFEQAFGEAPGALLGIGIMTDTDNTLSNAIAWYGQPELLSRKSGATAGLSRLD